MDPDKDIHVKITSTNGNTDSGWDLIIHPREGANLSSKRDCVTMSLEVRKGLDRDTCAGDGKFVVVVVLDAVLVDVYVLVEDAPTREHDRRNRSISSFRILSASVDEEEGE